MSGVGGVAGRFVRATMARWRLIRLKLQAILGKEDEMFYYNIQWQGFVEKDRTTTRFALQATTYAQATSDAALIKAAFIALSQAFVRKAWLTEELDALDESRPTDDAANAFEEAAIVVHTTDGTTPDKAVIRIPAPIETLFLSDNSTINPVNLLATGLLAVLDGTIYVSDGETIDTSVDNGFSSGNKRSKAKSFKA